jgi:hypothetical protein
METISSVPIVFTEEEREIVIELLDRERTKLPVEVRHTRTGKFRDVLKRRLDIITELLNRMGER